ncbi:MAG: ATP-binding protein [Cytophagales bacterium]|nr:ATP-binding protein [Cytophagales bacterium]
MGFSSFRVGVLIRIIIISLTTFLLVYLISFNEKYVSAVIVATALLIEISELFRFTTVTNKKITRFLESIRYSDFSTSFSHDNKLGKSFQELNRAFNNVADAFRNERAEKEEHLNYLNTVVQHVTTGLISFDGEGKVGLINSAAKRFLNIPQLRNISEILTVHVTLYKKLKQMRPGEKALIRVSSDLNLAVHATELKLRGHSYKLIALQNIHSELESKEVEAWQNLTRVLRHEIMNSITPIASLTGTLNEILAEDLKPYGADSFEISDESLSDLNEGLQTIENRSKGLIKFVDAYRDYTSIPKPKFGLIKIDELFEHICKLLNHEFKELKIDFKLNVMFDNLEITADRELIEMVLINLLKNAKEALKDREEPKIEMMARIDEEQRVLLEVKDNGPGIIQEALERIFIPFYTTKKSGSGIGLALSRQIMQLHNGTLSVKSEPDLYTIFTLRF